MKIIHAMIIKLSEKVLADMEKLSNEISFDKWDPISDASKQLHNDEVIKKLVGKRHLLSMLKDLV